MARNEQDLAEIVRQSHRLRHAHRVHRDRDAELGLRVESQLRGETGSAAFMIEEGAAADLADLPAQSHTLARFDPRYTLRDPRLHARVPLRTQYRPARVQV